VYASREGLGETISKAIGEHYMPRFAGDSLASTIGGKIISVADRLDTLICFFAAGKIPKGSADPFALRRQANGLLETILHSHWIINVDKLIDFAVDLAATEFGTGRIFTKSRGSGDAKKTTEVPEFDWELARTSIKEFLIQRLPFVFEISHKNTEINKAVLEIGSPLVDLNRRHMMVHLMYNLRARPEFPNLVEAITRVVNIGDRSVGAKVTEKSFITEHEKSVYACFKHLDTLLTKPTYYEPLAETEFLKAVEPVNMFFDNVLVNDKDEQVKVNRHALVNYGASLFEQVCAFKLLSV
jgi:glycyl-tRNA synthetase beta chain